MLSPALYLSVIGTGEYSPFPKRLILVDICRGCILKTEVNSIEDVDMDVPPRVRDQPITTGLVDSHDMIEGAK